LKEIFEIEKYPELGNHLVGVDVWSLNWEIESTLQKQKQLQVLVLAVGHRKNVYE